MDNSCMQKVKRNILKTVYIIPCVVFDPFWKFHEKSVDSFSCNVANRRTGRQTNKQAHKPTEMKA